MQDLDIPPQEEGNTNGAVDGVRRDEARVARWAATARSIRAFLPLPWITPTAPIWVRIMATATRDEDRAGPVFPRLTRWAIRSVARSARGCGFARLRVCRRPVFPE